VDRITAARRNDKTPRTWEQLTLDEAKAIVIGSRIPFLTRQGNVAEVKVTSIKKWKTRPGDIHIGLKYGLYEYSYTEYIGGKFSRGEILVREITE